ncbi:MAG: hypothetical protein ACK52X_04045 [bacterium]
MWLIIRQLADSASIRQPADAENRHLRQAAKTLAATIKRTPMKKIIIYMGLFTWLSACKNTDNKSDITSDNKTNTLKEITSRFDTAEGWHDVFFSIVNSTSTDSTRTYICKGLHKGKTVGFQIEIRSDMGAGITPAGELNSQKGFIKNAVQFKSIGEESNELIKVLGDLYGKPTIKTFSRQTIWLTAFSLNQQPVDLDKKNYYKLKIFFDQDENLYSELYLNINTQTSEIELNEKDEEYRDGVIKNLTK